MKVITMITKNERQASGSNTRKSMVLFIFFGYQSDVHYLA